MILANVIFPAFLAPYISYLFFPLAALAAIASEIGIFKLRYRQLAWLRAIWIAVTANIVSWVFGVALSFVLPSGLVPKVMRSGDREFTTVTQGPQYGMLMLIGFSVAFVLSIIIEYFVWRFLQRKSPLPHLLVTTIIAHISSYVLLIGIAFAYIRLAWW